MYEANSVTETRERCSLSEYDGTLSGILGRRQFQEGKNYFPCECDFVLFSGSLSQIFPPKVTTINFIKSRSTSD